MDGDEILWEEQWVGYGDDVYYLRCLLQEEEMRYEVYNIQHDTATPVITFELLDEARAWLKQQNFVYDDKSDTNPKRPDRRLSPKQKKTYSYKRDSRSLPVGHGASRRVKSMMPKIRRRQLRRRMKAYLREQIQTLHREISDQSFRSFRAKDVPKFSKELPLEDALKEKDKRRKDGEKTTRKAVSKKRIGSLLKRLERKQDRNDNRDLPDWLRPQK